MDKALDMSLDDIIKSRKSSTRGRGRGGGGGGGRVGGEAGARGGSRGGARGRGQGRASASAGRGATGFLGSRRMAGAATVAPRQGPLRVNARPSAFTIAKSFRRSNNIPWRRDLFEDSMEAAGLPRLESGTELHISNLDQRVSNDDIRELFSEIGELKRYAIHYDKNGQPSGSAEVLYAKRSDAFAALKRYNDVKLDGRPMKIEIVSPKSEVPVSARVNVIGGMSGRMSRKVVMGDGGSYNAASVSANRGRGSYNAASVSANRGRGQVVRGQPRNGFGRGRGRGQGRGFMRGRGRGRKQPVKKSADELDKELEHYHAEAMQM